MKFGLANRPSCSSFDGTEEEIMIQPKWQNFEDQIRGIATLIFGQNCTQGRIAGVNFDGAIERNDQETIAIEISQQNDLDKVRQGIGRLILAKQTLMADGVLLRGYIVLSKNQPKQ